MDELAAQAALDPAAMREEVHQPQEENGNGKGEERRDVRVHISIQGSLSLQTSGSETYRDVDSILRYSS